MIYLVYRSRLTSKARRDLKGFWSWLSEREEWFYRDLPMVEEVRWFSSVVGEVYTIENWSSFSDEAAYGQYRARLAQLKDNEDWESARVAQEDWWQFIDNRIVGDPPVEIGFSRRSGEPG